MKKFIVFIITAIMLMATSCATTYISQTYGDISLLNYSGEPIRKYDNAVIDTETTTTDGIAYVSKNGTYGIKAGGALNFRDNDGEYHYINGGIIIIDNLHSKTASYSGSGKVNADEVIEKEEKFNEIKKNYALCKAQIDENNKRIRKLKRGTEEYNVLSDQNKAMKEKMKKLQQDAYKLGYDHFQLNENISTEKIISSKKK